MANYRLVFRGELREGVDREECVAGLARLLGMDRETVDSRLFSGRSVVVKKSVAADEVERYREAFARAGAVLEAEPIDTPEAEQAPDTATAPDPEAPPEPPAPDPEGAAADAAAGAGPTPTREPAPAEANRKGVWAIVALLLVGLVVAGGWYTLPLWHGPESERVAAIENALATESLVLLGHADLARAITIEERFLGEPDPDALPPTGQALLARMTEAGMAPREDFDQLLLAGYVTDDGLDWAMVALGRFDQAAIRQVVEARYSLEGVSGNRLLMTYVDEQTCERSAPVAIEVREDRLVMAPAGQMDTLLQRLDSKAGPQVDLERWREFRRGQLASLGLLMPDALAQGAGGMTGMMAKSAHQGLGEAVDGAYLGLSARALPPGISLSGALSSAETAWVDDRYQQWQAALESGRADAANLSSHLAALFDHVSLSKTPELITARLDLGRDFATDIQRLMEEALQAAFRPMQVSHPTASGQAPAERVVEHPIQFASGLSLEDLQPFDAIEDSQFRAAWQGGPFGLRVRQLGLDEKDPERLTLTLEAQGRELPNTGDKAENIRLRVTDVTDGKGQSLMPRPACGSDRNQDPAVFGSRTRGQYFQGMDLKVYYSHSAKKTLRLAPGTRPDDVAAIEGRIELDLPVQVERRVVQAPLAGKSVSHGGARVAFGEASGSKISYETSGEVGRILAIRPLNDQGQVLDTSGGSAMTRLLGSGRVHSQNVQGTPASVEVVFADSYARKQYPFRLDSAYPTQSGDTYEIPPLKAGTAGALEQALAAGPPEGMGDYYREPRALADLGAVQVAFSQISTGGFYNFYANTEVRAPQVAGLAGNLAAGTLSLERLVDSQGRETALEVSQPLAFEREGMFVNGVFRPDEDRPYLSAQVQLTDGEYEGEGAARLDGAVTLKLPLRLEKVTVDNLELGRVYDLDGLGLRMVWLREGLAGFTVVSGRDRLAGLRLSDDQGRPVSYGARSGGVHGEQDLIQVQLGGTPRSMTVYRVDEAVEKRLPFSVDLNGG